MMNLDAITKELELKLANLEERLHKVVVDATQAHSADSGEQAQERENDEVIDAIGEETAKSIRQVKKALRQIKRGEYGVCVNCGNDIEVKRLVAIPESIRCTACS